MKLATQIAIGLVTGAVFSATAYAGDVNATNAGDTVKTVQTIDADGQVGQLTIYAPASDKETSAVLGAFEAQNTEAYIVEDMAGDLYINHLVPVSELPDPTLEVETEDTFTIEYEGRIYTNKIVDPD